MKVVTELNRLQRLVCCAMPWCLAIAAVAVQAADRIGSGDPAATLRAGYAAIKVKQGETLFKRELYLESKVGNQSVAGEIHAMVKHPFVRAAAALHRPGQWCDILILHLNTKYCRPVTNDRGTVLQVVIGKKFDQPIDDAYLVNFDYRVVTETAEFLQVTLHAADGPLSTSNYRIILEATPAGADQTIIRLAYSYASGMVGQVAMQAYLATAGRDKVGFTVVGTEANGQPRYVGGMRGVVERNTLRYYLAIESYLGALDAAPPVRLETQLRSWFAASEMHARQLHEMDREAYLVMKRYEYSRQQTALVRAAATATGAGG